MSVIETSEFADTTDLHKTKLKTFQQIIRFCFSWLDACLKISEIHRMAYTYI